MDNIIDGKKNLNNKTILYSGILAIIIFILIGNLNLIVMLCGDTLNLSKIDILKRGFSISIFDISILYITLCILVHTVLKDKQQVLKNYVKARMKSNSILDKELKFLSTIISISILINLFIKFILYFIFRKTLVSMFNIGFNNVLLFSFYVILVTCILYLLVVINYVSIKDFVNGTFVYCVILGTVSVVLGAGSLFISEKILWIQNILNMIYAVYNPIIMPFYAFYDVYNRSLSANIGIIFSMCVVTLLLKYVFKNFCDMLNKDNIKKFYINSILKKMFFICGAIAMSYIVFLIGFTLLISFNVLTYDVGMLIINLIQVVFAGIIYMKLNTLYLNKQNLKNKKLVKDNKNLKKDDILKNVHNKLNENIYKESLQKTQIFKSLNLENELLDCEMIKNFSFNEMEEYPLNEDDSVKEYKNDLNGIKVKEINNEIDKDDKSLIEFLNSDNVIKN